jgi:SepF-like predicted cell division protein (DUF552 family)
MRKFSKLDLIKTSFITGTGDVFGKMFESKYVTLDVEVKKMSLLRGKVLVSDVNDILKQEQKEKNKYIKLFTIENLFDLIYKDFLNRVQKGTDLSALAHSLLIHMKNKQQENSEVIRELKQMNHNHFSFEDQRVQKRKKYNERLTFPIQILKKYALRGEVLLYDLVEQ